MSNLKLKRIINRNILILISIITNPFIYQLNPIAFLANVFVQILLIISAKEKIDTKIWMIYILSFSYFGLDLFGLKIYDLVMVMSIIFLLFRRHKFKLRFVDLFVLILFTLYMIFVWSINEYIYSGLVEISRYLLSFLTFILFSNLKPNLKAIINYIPVIAIANIFQALELYLITVRNGATIFSSYFINVQYFYSNQEMRFNGFFTDPNKFLCFFFFLYIIYEYCCKKIQIQYKHRLITKFILILGILISFSRTGLIVVSMYFALKLTRRVFNKYSIIFHLFIFLIIVFAIILIFYGNNYILQFINYIFVNSAKILGRERTAEINPFITDDNRYLIWKMAIEYIKLNPLIGYGPQSFERLLPYPSHNTYLTLLLDFGFIGCIFFITLMKPIYRIARLEVLISFIVIPTLFFDLSNFRLLYILLAISICSDYYKKLNINKYQERVANKCT